MTSLVEKLSLVNKLLYTSDMIGGQAIAQSRNLWLLFSLAPPKDKGLPASIPGLDWGFIDIDPRVFVGVLLTAGRIIEAVDDPLSAGGATALEAAGGAGCPSCFSVHPSSPIFRAALANAVG